MYDDELHAKASDYASNRKEAYLAQMKQGLPMTNEELLDHLALEVLRVSPQSARDAYRIAEDMIERRQEILNRWALLEAVIDDGIENLQLTVRSERCLKAEGIFTITQLTGCTEQRLLKTPNIGRKAIHEIKERMAEFGYKLRGQE
jgi:DNA-directed RNA polymerase alpha subunit